VESTKRPGVIAQCFHKGSIPVGSDGFAGGNGATALITSCAPDLVTCSALDGTVSSPAGTGGIVPAMQALNTIFDGLSVVPDVLWYGIPNTQGDTAAATVAYNRAMASVALYKRQGFVDPFAALGSWSRENALGLAADATHPTSLGWALVHQDFMQQFGYSLLAFGRSWIPQPQAARNLWTGNMGAWPNGTSFSPPAGATTSIMPGINVFVAGSFSGSISASRITLDQTESPSCDQYGFRLTVTGASGTSSIVLRGGPARRAAGRQMTCTFMAKCSIDGMGFSMFAARYGGSGSSSGDVTNQTAKFSSAWKEFSICMTAPALSTSSESAGSTATFSIANYGACTIDIKDIRINVGPVSEPVNAPAICDTFVIDFPSIPANSRSAAQTVTLIGAQKGCMLKVQTPSGLPAGILLDAVCTADDSVSIYATNITTSAIDQSSLIYVISVIQ
jgi:hypothetical protein